MVCSNPKPLEFPSFIKSEQHCSDQLARLYFIFHHLIFLCYAFFSKTAGKVSIDPDALERLQVRKADFDFALENDIRPSFGANIEDFESYVGNGMNKLIILLLFITKQQKLMNDGVDNNFK